MSKSVTMKDIALSMGLSTVSVSKALSGKEGVSDAVRDAVVRKAQEMGYTYIAHHQWEALLASSGKSASPSAIAYSGGMDEPEIKIGVLVADRFLGGDSYYANLYALLSVQCAKCNIQALLEVLKSDDESALHLPQFLANSKEKEIKAFIVLGQLSSDYIKALRQSAVPYIFLDFYDARDTSDAIVCDSMYGAYLLTDYLIKQGHRDIGFLGNMKATSSIMDRYLGYHSAILRNNLVTRADCIVMDRYDTASSTIFDSFALPQALPTAFVCNCDDAALQLVRQLQRMGISVPDDVSVTGYDNHITATICDPPLTTFNVDKSALAECAVAAIKEKIANPHETLCRKIIGGEIVYRKSVKNITAAQ